MARISRSNRTGDFAGDHNVPVKWSATEYIAWKVAVPGRGWSSPVLSNGKLYLTTAVGESDKVSLRTLSFDAKDGRTLWDVEVLKPDPDTTKAMHRKTRWRVRRPSSPLTASTCTSDTWARRRSISRAKSSGAKRD